MNDIVRLCGPKLEGERCARCCGSRVTKYLETMDKENIRRNKSEGKHEVHMSEEILMGAEGVECGVVEHKTQWHVAYVGTLS